MTDSPSPTSRERATARDWVDVFAVDLGCLQCGRMIGKFETRRWPWFGPVLFRPPGGQPATPVADWSKLRCVACGGNVYADEVRTAKVYASVSWDDLEQPRRGRPPKWLVAERHAIDPSADE